ncbi:unnamed protein product [Clonostachys rosea]|uniref:Uncharacterized protein n=1 Tax=Bionectria ochroleuca TaxID=29856 RepID=A0ABY6TT38_BIOOC|nr:unnamed protein product [Clonostachys rosea]
MKCECTIDTPMTPNCPYKESDPSHREIVVWRDIADTCAKCHHGPTRFQENRAKFERDLELFVLCYRKAKELGDRENIATLERLIQKRTVQLMNENSRTQRGLGAAQ